MYLFNTLTRKKERLEPIRPGELKIYCCGPTDYNDIHLGNARPLVVFDSFRRYLKSLGYKVTFVQNFTDIDDKVIRRAQEEQLSYQEIAERYIQAYRVACEALNVQPADVEPRATDKIPEILSMIEALIERGHAYVAEDGVYFSTKSDPNYGQLSGYHLDELTQDAGGREVSSDQKQDAADFALWKFKKPGEPAWPSPWGEGRPGWHIECSAMVRAELGDTIDIHCGGKDLIFPHHENEIAQSTCCTGHPLARYWMHNGHVNVNHSKMSKSAGNFFTVKDLLETYDGMVLRFFILSGHYRSPIDFSRELLDASKRAWERIQVCVRNLRFALEGFKADTAISREDKLDPAWCEKIQVQEEAYQAALADDFNTAQAMGALFNMVKELNQALSEHRDPKLLDRGLERLLSCLQVLGLDPEREREQGVPAEIETMAKARDQARKEKNWAEADRLRDAIQQAGWVIEDTPQGAKLYRA